MVPLTWSLQNIGGNTKSVYIIYCPSTYLFHIFLNHQLTSQILMLISESTYLIDLV